MKAVEFIKSGSEKKGSHFFVSSMFLMKRIGTVEEEEEENN